MRKFIIVNAVQRSVVSTFQPYLFVISSRFLLSKMLLFGLLGEVPTLLAIQIVAQLVKKKKTTHTSYMRVAENAPDRSRS